jgi:hypothetical protein
VGTASEESPSISAFRLKSQGLGVGLLRRRFNQVFPQGGWSGCLNQVLQELMLPGAHLVQRLKVLCVIGSSVTADLNAPSSAMPARGGSWTRRLLLPECRSNARDRIATNPGHRLLHRTPP